MLESARGSRITGLSRLFQTGGWLSYLASIVVIVLVGVVLRNLGLAGSPLAGAIPLLFLVFLVAWTWGQLPATVAAIVASLTFNYFFTLPDGFSKPTPEEGVLLVALLAVAYGFGRVTDRMKAVRQEALPTAGGTAPQGPTRRTGVRGEKECRRQTESPRRETYRRNCGVERGPVCIDSGRAG